MTTPCPRRRAARATSRFAALPRWLPLPVLFPSSPGHSATACKFAASSRKTWKVRRSGNGRTVSVSRLSNDLSVLGFRGRESLGGELEAFFQDRDQ